MKNAIHKIINHIADFFRSISPASQGRISGQEIFNLLYEKGVKFNVLVDSQYETISPDDMRKFLKFNFSKTKKYATEKYDCDNFSAVLYGQTSYFLPGFAIGIVHVKTPRGAHVLNVMIVSETKNYKNEYNLYYIEPQTSEIFSFDKGEKRGYKPYFVII